MSSWWLSLGLVPRFPEMNSLQLYYCETSGCQLDEPLSFSGNRQRNTFCEITVKNIVHVFYVFFVWFIVTLRNDKKDSWLRNGRQTTCPLETGPWCIYCCDVIGSLTRCYVCTISRTYKAISLLNQTTPQTVLLEQFVQCTHRAQFWQTFFHPLGFNRISYIILLTHWGRDKMAAISQTTFSNGFSWMKLLEFRLKFHWRLFLRDK